MKAHFLKRSSRFGANVLASFTNLVSYGYWLGEKDHHKIFVWESNPETIVIDGVAVNAANCISRIISRTDTRTGEIKVNLVVLEYGDDGLLKVRKVRTSKPITRADGTIDPNFVKDSTISQRPLRDLAMIYPGESKAAVSTLGLPKHVYYGMTEERINFICADVTAEQAKALVEVAREYAAEGYKRDPKEVQNQYVPYRELFKKN